MADRRLYERILLYVWIAAVFSDAVAGALRYVLSGVGLIPLSYAPKALVIVLALMSFFRYKQSAVPLGALAVLAFASCVGLANGLGIQQILSGFALFLPLIFGAQAYLSFDRSRTAILKWSAIVLLVSCFGVAFSNYVTVPWNDLAYNVGDVAVEGVRTWSYLGVNRPPGFSRGSVSVATIILITTCLLYPTTLKRNKLLAILLMVMGIGFAVVSTTKGIVAAMSIAFIIYTLPRKLYGFAAGVLAVLIIAMPVSTVLIRYTLGFDNPIIAFLTVSFDERLTTSWPNGINVDWNYGIPFLGRGLGGVGTAARYLGDSGSILSSAAVMDNFSLYMYGHFGLIGVALFLYMMRSAVKLIKRGNAFDRGVGLSLLALLISGLSMDFIENLPATIIVGMALAAAAKSALPARYAVIRRQPTPPANAVTGESV